MAVQWSGDGQETTNADVIVGMNMVKVRRLRDGSIIGICGDVTDALAFVDWLNAGGKKPKFTRRCEAMLLEPDGRLKYAYSPEMNWVPSAAPFAIGHGASFALAAMDCGKTPREAVVIAAGRDPYTGGTVTTLGFDDDTTPKA